MGNSEPVSIADEIPFEIPDSWEWVRLGCIINLKSGQDFEPSGYNSTGHGIPYITGASNIEEGKVIINRWTEIPNNYAMKDDLLIVCKGAGVGKMAVLKHELVHIARQIMAITPIHVDLGYLQIVISSNLENLRRKMQGVIPGISRSDVLELLFPLPPVPEQERIVSKIKELEPIIEAYDVAYSKAEKLNKEFPDLLKKSILQQAIQGKLVPQDPNDEPVDALLSRIRAEKQRLIREGKIKKDKHESFVFRRDNSHYEKQGDVIRCIDDEIPFEIPSTWNWARISTIVLKDVGGGTPDKSNPDFWNGDIPWMSVKDFSSAKNGIIEDTIDHITPSGVNNSSTKVIDPDAIILCTRMGLGKTARIAKPTAINQDLRAIWLSCNISEEFFLSFYSTLSIVGSGVTVKGIKKEDLLSILIPIPPYGEQVRIIQSVNRIFEFVDAL